MKINTPEVFMLALEWDQDDLDRAKKYLNDWDSQTDSFYNKYKRIHKDFDVTEREHYRNCVNFWEKRLKNETQSP